MARTSSLLGKERNRISRPTGFIIAPPSPCSTRIATSVSRLVADAHSTDPAVNST